MAKSNSALGKIREICLSLPDTKETLTWGQPHFRVGDKIFSGYGEEKGKPVIGFKLEMEHADEVIKDPRFCRAPYVGHKGWVSMDASSVRDWDEVRPSWRAIASSPRKRAGRSSTEAPPQLPNAKRLLVGTQERSGLDEEEEAAGRAESTAATRLGSAKPGKELTFLPSSRGNPPSARAQLTGQPPR